MFEPLFNKVSDQKETSAKGCNYDNRGTTSVGGGRFLLYIFENWKMCPDFWGKKCSDCLQLWVKLLIQNAVLTLSRRKNSKIFQYGPFLECVVDKIFTELLLFQNTYPNAQKNSWLRPCALLLLFWGLPRPSYY